MGLKNNIYACEEHVDIAIDDCIDKKEGFPDMESCDNEKCSYCDESSKYKVN